MFEVKRKPEVDNGIQGKRGRGFRSTVVKVQKWFNMDFRRLFDLMFLI